MPPRKRNQENRGLPPRWRYYHGAYYYQVPPGMESRWDGKKQFRLGRSLADAYRAFAERAEIKRGELRIMSEVFDRYLLEIVPRKAPKTQTSNVEAIKRLRPIFGAMKPSDIQPRHVYQYVDKRGAKVAAHREIEVLSHALTKAVEWGAIAKHPFKGEVRLEGEQPRTRYVEDWEIVECLSLPSLRIRGSVRAIHSYIRLKLLTGLRRGDLLRLQISDLGPDGLSVRTSKTNRAVVYDATPELMRAIADAKAARPVDISPWLFCNRKGECYYNEEKGTANGWESMWQRFMARVLTETKVTERFTEHDLRAKVASDAESLERARQLLAHVDSKITNRVYRRKPELVRPGKGV